MKILTVSTMRNESDIVEVFVRYHAQFVDKIAIIDHLSTDSSPDIVKQLMKEGLPVELHSYGDIGHNQNAIINVYAKQHLKREPYTWVIPLDLDEFLVNTEKRSIRRVFEEIDESHPVYLPWRSYIPTRDDANEERVVLNRIKHRLANEAREFHKVAAPGALLKQNRLGIAMGNHSVINVRTKRAERGTLAEGLALAHYSVRSPEQFLGKVLPGWLATLAKADYGKNEAFHWKNNFDRFLSNGIPNYKDLCDIACGLLAKDGVTDKTELVCDPVPYAVAAGEHISKLDYETKPVVAALLVAESIAKELGEVSAALKPVNLPEYASKLILIAKRFLRKKMLNVSK